MTTPDTTPEALRALADRLTSWAQNEEMIDQFFTTHGQDCNEAAATLLAIAEKMEEDKHTVQKIRGRKIP